MRRFRFVGGREEKLFFELFLVPTFMDGVLLVLDNAAAPTAIGWVCGEGYSAKMAQRTIGNPLRWFVRLPRKAYRRTMNSQNLL